MLSDSLVEQERSGRLAVEDQTACVATNKPTRPTRPSRWWRPARLPGAVLLVQFTIAPNTLETIAAYKQ